MLGWLAGGGSCSFVALVLFDNTVIAIMWFLLILGVG